MHLISFIVFLFSKYRITFRLSSSCSCAYLHRPPPSPFRCFHSHAITFTKQVALQMNSIRETLTQLRTPAKQHETMAQLATAAANEAVSLAMRSMHESHQKEIVAINKDLQSSM